MKNLYYANFPNGYNQIVEKFIKKQDKNAFIKNMYNDSVLFFADEHFPFSNTIFYSNYLVYDYQKKMGDGAVNAEIKHLLERDDLKIYFPKEVNKIQLLYRSETGSKLIINPKLRNAFETMISKITKKRIGFFETSGELVIFVRKNGDCIFAKNITKQNSEFSKIRSNSEIEPEIAFALNFLSNPAEKEVSLDPFSNKGMISYVRAFSFKKANVIANEENKEDIIEIKSKAKRLKEKSFSVLNYNFLSNNFPIKFIDKIVTSLPCVSNLQTAFFEKVYMLKVKKIVAICSAPLYLCSIANNFYEVKECYENLYNLNIPLTYRKNQRIYVLEIKKD